MLKFARPPVSLQSSHFRISAFTSTLGDPEHSAGNYAPIIRTMFNNSHTKSIALSPIVR